MPAQLFWFVAIINFLLLPVTFFNVLTSYIPALSTFRQFVVVSGSMEPVIPTGSIILAERENSYRIGDIVTFSQNGREYIAHRIVNKIAIGRDTYFSTKGDSNTHADMDLVHESVVYGKILTIVPILGDIVIFYKTPYGMILGSILIFMFLIKSSQKAKTHLVFLRL